MLEVGTSFEHVFRTCICLYYRKYAFVCAGEKKHYLYEVAKEISVESVKKVMMKNIMSKYNSHK